MEPAGKFPSSHTTTTTTTSTRVTIAPCQFDPSYVRTVPGILKIVQMVADILGFICVVSSRDSYHSGWYDFVAMTGFLLTGTLLLFYFFHLIERLHMLPWLLIEFIYCTLWTLFFFISAVLVATRPYTGGYIAGAVFGFVATVAYGYDAFLKFMGWRSGDIAQGERHIATATTTTATY